MPQITIIENDATKAISTVGTDIPLIPGFCTQAKAVGDASDANSYNNIPVFCSTISEFESIFGANPPIIDSKLDLSYIMASELLRAGMPLYYFGECTSNKTSSQLLESYKTYVTGDDFKDKDAYSFKYITTGAYSNYDVEGLASALLSAAKDRGDCIVLIEGSQGDTDTQHQTFFENISADTAFTSAGSYGAAFTPWASYTLSKTYKNSTTSLIEAVFPGCYAYLRVLAANIKTSPNWLAMAGAARGQVPNIKNLNVGQSNRLSNTIANNYQPKANGIAINPITNIQPYGLTIWGNRTLAKIGDGLTATCFLHTRNMISDIKKVAYRAAKSQLFEQNSETLWMNFKADVAPFLDQLKAGNGISDYKFIKMTTHQNTSPLGRAEFACAIKIIPIDAVEDFEITIQITDADVVV